MNMYVFVSMGIPLYFCTHASFYNCNIGNKWLLVSIVGNLCEVYSVS
jgi:hypothetical protein